MTMSLPGEMVDEARREREAAALGPITSNIDRLIKDGMSGIDAVAKGAAEQMAPVAQLFAGGELKLPTLDELTPEWMRPKPVQAAPVQPAQPGMQMGSVTLTDGRQQQGPSMRPGESVGNVEMSNGGGSLEDWARSEARRLRIDPEIAVRVAMSEGGFSDPVRQSDVVYQGEREQSYGPYQLNVTGGLGTQAIARGIDPRRPENARAAVTYALEHAARNGWGNFHGAAQVGIGQWDGIGVDTPAPAAQGPRQTTPVEAEQTPAAQAQVGRPTQFAQGLSWEESIAACGLAGVAWFTQRTGRTPATVAEVKQAAEVSKKWDAQTGMYGAEATASLLRDTYNIPAVVEDGVDWAKVRRDVLAGNPVMFDTTGGSNGHYYTVSGARQRADGQWEYDLDTSATDLRASQGRRWYTADEVVNLGFGAPHKTIYVNNPNSPTPSVAVSLTATPPSPSGESVAAPSPAAAGASPPPAAAPPAPWANETGGGPMMMKADESADFLPGDGGYAPQVQASPDRVAETFDPDQGAREAIPGSVGSQPLPQTPNPMTYGPIQQGDVAEGPPTLGDITYQNGGEPTQNGDWQQMPVRPMEAQQPEPQFSEASMPDIASGLKPVWDAAGQVIGYVQGAVSNVVQQAQSNMAQNRRNAEDANRATGYGQVSSTPGEPDYVPPTTSPLTWATNTLGEAISTFAPPAGGAPQQMDRMQAIEQQAAEWLGVDGSGMQGIAVRKRAVTDPRWRAAQPALASEYDDLQRDFGLNVMGSVGDAAKFDAAARTAGRAASQGATRAAGQEAVNVAENMVPPSNAARVAAADARMAETGSTATGMAVGPTPGVRGARQAPTEPWQMAPSEWQAEMARVSPDGTMPDPQVDNEAYRRWYQLNANKPAEVTPTLQTAPFETDARLRPAIESSYLRPDDYRFVSGITVSPRSSLQAENTYRARAGLQAGGVPHAKFERDGRMTFQGEILANPRVGRTMTHEVGHSIENNLPESLIERWQAEIHPASNDAFAYGRHLQNGGEAPPTPYAGQNWSEDFAESFTEWRQAQAEGRAPNLGPLRQRFMQDVDAWLSGGRSLERGTMDGQRFEQPRLLSTVGASPGGAGRDIWARAATDVGNALMGSMVGAIAPADSNEERLRNTALGAAGFPLLGRGMRRAGGALGSFGPVPNGGGRPIRQTVETLQDELDGMRSLIQRARQAGDAALEKRAIDRAWELESALVDARNARTDLEPRITSDVGRRIESLPIDERTADDIAGLGRERVSPDAAADLTQPSAVATDMRGRMNSALPFDPSSAAMGGAAGAASEDENGDSGDPLRTAAGILLAGVGGGMSPGARRALESAMKKAEALKAAGRDADAAAVVDAALRKTGGYDPRLSREPVLPGMEPPRGRVELPNISDAPNRPRVLGDERVVEPTFPGMDPPYVRPNIPDVSSEPNLPGNRIGNVPPSQLREPTFPGMEGPYTRPNIPDVSEAPNRGPVLGDVPPSAVNQGALPGFDPLRDAQAPGAPGQFQTQLPPAARQALNEFPEARNWYERARMRNEQRMRQAGIEPPSPLRWLSSLVGNIGYSSMLGPGTLSVNLFTGIGEPIWGAPKELLRSAGRAVQQRNLSALREPGEMLAGAVHGMSRLGESLIDLAKSRGQYAPNPNFPMLSSQTADPAARTLVQALEAPGRVWSGLPDAIFGTIAQHAGEAREAAQIATNKGLKGAEWKAEVTRLLEDSRAVGKGELPTSPEVQQVVDAGAAYAKRQTYRDELGNIGRKAEKYAKLGGLPVLGTWASPFFRTPWNAALAQAEKSPIGFAMNRQASRFDKHYDAILGTAAILGLGAYAKEGGVTGSGPTDPKEREMLQQKGWQPYSTLIGNVYVPNRMLGIFETPLNMAGELHDAIAHGKADATGTEQWSTGAERIGKLISQNPYALSGIVSLMEVPKFGLASAVSDQLTRLTPAAATFRTIGTAGDTMERTTDRGKDVPMEDQIIQRWQSGVGMRSGLPVAQDAFGQPKANERPGGWALAPRMRQKKDDPIGDIFTQAGVKIGDPKSELSISRSPLIPSMPLSPRERREWDRRRGAILLEAGQEIAADPEWAGAPKEVREKVLRRVMENAAKIADNEMKDMIGDDEINRRVDREAEKKAS